MRVKLEDVCERSLSNSAIIKEDEDDGFCISLAEAARSEDDGTRYTMDEVIKELGLENLDL